MWETQVWSLGREVPLEKEMATHFSILAWKISWTEESTRLQSMRSQRVGHDWATSLHFTSTSSPLCVLRSKFNSVDSDPGVQSVTSVSGSSLCSTSLVCPGSFTLHTCPSHSCSEGLFVCPASAGLPSASRLHPASEEKSETMCSIYSWGPSLPGPVLAVTVCWCCPLAPADHSRSKPLRQNAHRLLQAQEW